MLGDKKATIYDVAKACGLSSATVSRVLSNSTYPVKAATREKILAAAKDLNYLPNAFGQALKTQHSKDVGIIVPNISNTYYSILLQGVYDRVFEMGYNPILLNSYRDAEIEAQNIALLLQKQVRGIVVVSINPDATAIQNALDYGCKVVVVEQETDLDCIKVGFNFHRGAYLATAHLVENGHAEIGFVGAPMDRFSRRQKLAGYKQCLEDAGLPIREEFIRLDNKETDGANLFEFENGLAVGKEFCAMENRPTGYFCLNDMTAFGVIKAFSQHGLRVPQDVSVVGFDNIPFTEISFPELTTIDQSAYDTGSIASRMLIESIQEPDKLHYSLQLEPKLMVRGSVAKIK